MNIRVILFSFGILLPLSTVRADLNDLQITATPTHFKVSPNQTFFAEVGVKNISKNIQHIRVMSCSWDQHWMPNIQQISVVPSICTRNVATTIELKPNDAYVRKINLVVSKGSKTPLRFKVGFSPLGSIDKAWSNEMSVAVSNAAASGESAPKHGH